NVKHIPKVGGHAPVTNEPDAVDELTSIVKTKFKEFVNKSFVSIGIKLMQNLLPNLGSAMEDFTHVIKLLNLPQVSSAVINDEFIGKIIDALVLDEKTNIDKFVELIKRFDVGE
ncbi:MAG: hypothetical protein KAH32_08225, partial [Chlamydiia bacterium]|nr:hypothetical protein [Chlamydiia bacterium]